jgi:enoyl-[acyl-carrier-protein] reductase (NADH)
MLRRRAAASPFSITKSNADNEDKLSSSRGIGRGIALKLAEKEACVAVHYYHNREAAQATLEKIRELWSNGFLVQADVCQADEIRRTWPELNYHPSVSN